MSKELERHISERTDEDLYEMLYVHPDDWTPDALELAEQEWKRRALTPDRLTVVQAVGEERKLQREGIKDEPLTTGPRVFFFLCNFNCCFGLIPFLIAYSLYKSNGYERKFWDCIKCMAYGSGCLFALGLIYVILEAIFR